jgi:hypothetical protein
MTMTEHHDVTIEDIVPLYQTAAEPTGRVSWRSRVGVTTYNLDRRQVLKAGLTMGTAIGLTTLGFFPKAAEASHNCRASLQTTIAGPCPVGVGNCSPACGPSPVYLDTCGSNGYHKYSGSYRNRPNECNSTGSDGWNWFGAGCCSSSCGRTYRCHDGCKLISGAWKHSICRVVIASCIC